MQLFIFFFLGLVRERLSTAGALITNPRLGVGRTEKEHAPSADSTALIRDHRHTEIAQQVTVAIYRAVAMTTQPLGNQTHEELNLARALCKHPHLRIQKPKLQANVSFFAYLEERLSCCVYAFTKLLSVRVLSEAKKKLLRRRPSFPSYRVAVDLGFAVNNSLFGTYQTV